MAKTKQEVQKILAKPVVSSKPKAEGLAALKVVELKALAKQYDLPVSGPKAILVERLEKYQKEASKKKSPVATKKTVRKAPAKKAKKITTKKIPLDLTTQEGISTLQVYRDALALMGPDRFVDETLVTMAAVRKEKK